jgi:anaerobic magnesium-protoporphyrin IX monomethyl ester cyclase
MRATQEHESFLLIRPAETSGVTEFSLGMGYVARALINAGFSVRTLCCDLEPLTDVAFEETLRCLRPRFVGIGGMYGSFLDLIRLCRLVRKALPHSWLILGGALPTSSPEHVLRQTGADFACIGPAEETVVRLTATLAGGGEPADVPGLCLRTRNCGFVRTGPSAQPRYLAGGPSTWPAWELFDGERYVRGTAYYPFPSHAKIAPIMTARGCPYSCNFCFQPARYSRRSLDDVFDEMEWLIDRYGVDGFYLEDDLFTLDRKRVLAFCQGLAVRHIETHFSVTGRFNIVDQEMLTALRSAGCISMFYGGEAADDETLTRMKKVTTVRQMRDGIAATREVGIFVRVGFMFGQPGEGREQLRSTVDLLKSIATGCFEPRVIYGCVPFPGTDLFDHCVREGLLTDEDDLFRRFRFQPRLLDQLPVNMTRILDEDPYLLLQAANRELLKFYEEQDPAWFRVISDETLATEAA